jgi:hypothetical protein
VLFDDQISFFLVLNVFLSFEVICPLLEVVLFLFILSFCFDAWIMGLIRTQRGLGHSKLVLLASDRSAVQ